jgi:hypothetical protein
MEDGTKNNTLISAKIIVNIDRRKRAELMNAGIIRGR